MKQVLEVVGPGWSKLWGGKLNRGKTTFLIHEAGCADLGKVLSDNGRGWEVEAESKLAAVQNVYECQLAERETPEEALSDAKDWVGSEFTWAPCVKLPKGF
jgi:hypothetical protein